MFSRTKKIIRLWVANQPAGIGHDATADYLAAGYYPTVMFDASDYEHLLLSMVKDVKKVGHGDRKLDKIDPPRLVVDVVDEYRLCF